MKFAHISDTHIKNLKYHYEYRIIFEQLYNTLREQKVDCIVHCGDIAHTKTQISPEFVDMCSDFFRSLAEIAPTYIICGNHDGNLKNSSRQDALSPIVDALNLTNLYLLKDSGETHVDDKFCLNVLSVFDRANWIKPTDDSKINIALYHGSISNCKTDINWTMANGEDELNIFDDFDFAIIAGGYNSFHEVVTAQLPSICFPNMNTGRDDQYARAKVASESGGMIVIRDRTERKISLAISRMMDPEVRIQMREKLASLKVPNGAEEAAKWIISQIDPSDPARK